MYEGPRNLHDPVNPIGCHGLENIHNSHLDTLAIWG